MPPLILGSEPAWFRKRAEKERINKKFGWARKKFLALFFCPKIILTERDEEVLCQTSQKAKQTGLTKVS